MKKFNITGSCNPANDYMVPLHERLKQAQKLVDNGMYFVINRPRQNGKTTFLKALARSLSDQYIVLSESFQEYSTQDFSQERRFARAFGQRMISKLNLSAQANLCDSETMESLQKAMKDEDFGVRRLFECISSICSKAFRPIILMIDEADSVKDNQIFVDFLGQCRSAYLNRDAYPGIRASFHSVILAGITDIRNIKIKLRPDEDHQQNSPWNIATSFDVRMSFDTDDISAMLKEYEDDHHTGMDIPSVAQTVFDWTSGYPYLVSDMCKIMDEKLHLFTKESAEDAASLVLKERNTLFDDIDKNLSNHKELSSLSERILFKGENIAFDPTDVAISFGLMYGLFVVEDGLLSVSNRIFETYLYNIFLAKDLNADKNGRYKGDSPNVYIHDGHLDMDQLLVKFVAHYNDVFNAKDKAFIEDNGRKIFLLYLKSVINGTGHYYIEAQTRDNTRTDIVVNYHDEEFVIELKVWRGQSYHERGEKQLLEYLDYFHTKKGYMVSFCFNKRKKPGVETIRLPEGRSIVEAFV